MSSSSGSSTVGGLIGRDLSVEGGDGWIGAIISNNNSKSNGCSSSFHAADAVAGGSIINKGPASIDNNSIKNNNNFNATSHNHRNGSFSISCHGTDKTGLGSPLLASTTAKYFSSQSHQGRVFDSTSPIASKPLTSNIVGGVGVGASLIPSGLSERLEAVSLACSSGSRINTSSPIPRLNKVGKDAEQLFVDSMFSGSFGYFGDSSGIPANTQISSCSRINNGPSSMVKAISNGSGAGVVGKKATGSFASVAGGNSSSKCSSSLSSSLIANTNDFNVSSSTVTPPVIPSSSTLLDNFDFDPFNPFATAVPNDLFNGSVRPNQNIISNSKSCSNNNNNINNNNSILIPPSNVTVFENGVPVNMPSPGQKQQKTSLRYADIAKSGSDSLTTVASTASTAVNAISNNSSVVPIAVQSISSVSVSAPIQAYSESCSNSNQRDTTALCPFAITGNCRFGSTCRYVHGMECPSCHRNCLHPYNHEQAEEHLQHCRGISEDSREETEIECGICYEKVLSKPDARFGILNCNHSFCLTCIRNWRANNSTGMDPQAVRSCPICRTVSHFITPSAIWIKDPEEKARLIEEYKRKLSAIPCKYFNYGDSQCPFGTSCFYAHILRDGSREQTKLRIYMNGDEQVKVVNTVKLFDFLEVSRNKRSNNNNNNNSSSSS